MNADVRQLCSVSAVTANRILGKLVEASKLSKVLVGGHWKYVVPEICISRMKSGKLVPC